MPVNGQSLSLRNRAPASEAMMALGKGSGRNGAADWCGENSIEPSGGQSCPYICLIRDLEAFHLRPTRSLHCTVKCLGTVV